MGTDTLEELGSRQSCSECGRSYAAEDLARFGTTAVCAECKPTYVQRLREGASAPNTPVYGGFWRRFWAMVIDNIILSVVTLPIRWMMIAPLVRGKSPVIGYWDSWSTFLIFMLLSWTIEITYSVYFTSKRGATLGKSAMGVKVVTANGGPISVGRAFGRHFARYLSSLTLGIGFIIAAFDDEKRALHDYICNTRVLRD